MRFNESGCVDDVETVVMFRSVNRVSYIEYGDLKISHPIVVELCIELRSTRGEKKEIRSNEYSPFKK